MRRDTIVSMNAAIPFIVILVLFVGIASFIWQLSRGRSLVEDWARENGYRLIACERRTLFRGPFFFTTNRGHEVYHVTVEDP
jgi:hypothetical protein